MDIGKAKENFDKSRKPKCFNCNIYGHLTKKCRKLKKEQDTRKGYKYNKVEYIAKDYRLGQKMKNCSIQELNNKKEDKQEDFGKGPKLNIQANVKIQDGKELWL